MYRCVSPQRLLCTDSNQNFALSPVELVWPVNWTQSLPRITSCQRAAGINTSVLSRTPIMMPFPPYSASMAAGLRETRVTFTRSSVWAVSARKQFLGDNFNNSHVQYFSWCTVITLRLVHLVFISTHLIFYRKSNQPTPSCLLLWYNTQRLQKIMNTSHLNTSLP